MNRRQLIRAFTMGTCALIFSVSGTSAQEAALSPRNKPPLKVGETLRYDSGLKITFLAVKNDSRCPINAQCISAGDAEVVLRVKAGNQAARKVVIHTNLEPSTIVIPAEELPAGMFGIPKSYVISIGRLNPLPNTEKKLLQSDYRLKLQISVAQ